MWFKVNHYCCFDSEEDDYCRVYLLKFEINRSDHVDPTCNAIPQEGKYVLVGEYSGYENDGIFVFDSKDGAVAQH